MDESHNDVGDTDLPKRASQEGGPQGKVPADGKLPPELREWARQLFTDEEILAGLQEIRETGGLELKDFIHELEEIVERRERMER